MKREKQDRRVYLSGLESSCRQPGETSAEAGVAVSIDVLDEGRNTARVAAGALAVQAARNRIGQLCVPSDGTQ